MSGTLGVIKVNSNSRQVNYCTSYRYRGVTLNQFLDYNFTADIQSEPAGRALGAI